MPPSAAASSAAGTPARSSHLGVSLTPLGGRIRWQRAVSHAVRLTSRCDHVAAAGEESCGPMSSVPTRTTTPPAKASASAQNCDACCASSTAWSSSQSRRRCGASGSGGGASKPPSSTTYACTRSWRGQALRRRREGVPFCRTWRGQLQPQAPAARSPRFPRRSTASRRCRSPGTAACRLPSNARPTRASTSYTGYTGQAWTLAGLERRRRRLLDSPHFSRFWGPS